MKICSLLFLLTTTHGFSLRSIRPIMEGTYNKNDEKSAPPLLPIQPLPSDSFSSDVTSTQLSASPAASSEDWTKARTHNSSWFRSLAVLTTLAAAALKAPVPAKTASVVHLLAFGTWFGTVVYTTFVAGITMFKNLPRHVFGKLQAKLFPKYFSLCSAMLILQIATLKTLALPNEKSIRVLGVALIATLLNQFVLEPASTQNMMERYYLEDTGGSQSNRYLELKSNFGKFHGMSSLCNLVALCGGVAHTVYLASRILL